MRLLLGYNEKQVCNQDVTKILPDIFDEMTTFPPQLDFGDSAVNTSIMSNISVCGGGAAAADVGGSGNGNDGGGCSVRAGSSGGGGGSAPRHFFEGIYSGKAVHADGSDIRVWYQVRTVLRDEGQAMHCIWLSGDNQPESDPLDRSFDRKATSLSAAASPLSASADPKAGEDERGGVDLDVSYGLHYDDSFRQLDGEASIAVSKSHSGDSGPNAVDDASISIIGEHDVSNFSSGGGRATSISPTMSELSSGDDVYNGRNDDMDSNDGGGGDAATVHPEEGFDHAYFAQDELGRGSFGFVKKCTHIESGVAYVVKFIRKDKILSESWDPTDESVVALPDLQGGVKPGMTPREVHLLLKLSHGNVIKAVDLLQNVDYYHLVMESHDVNGATAFDLFEFIDTNPDVDEQIASYVFRQVVDAVAYLHSQNVVHRDIKDENVILNEHLHARLIDFGSAAYMESGKVFDTFCGTIEYCAPEVLEGNPYPGPELEVFSLGVTLYTLMCGENPFMDVEETIRGGITILRDVSPACTELVMQILEPNPTHRITIPQLQHHPWLTMDVRAVVAAALQAEVDARSGIAIGRRPSEAASDVSDFFEYGSPDNVHLSGHGGGGSGGGGGHPLDQTFGRPESAGGIPMSSNGDGFLLSGPQSHVAVMSPIPSSDGVGVADISVMSPGIRSGRSSLTMTATPKNSTALAVLLRRLQAAVDLAFFCDVVREQEMEFEVVASLTAADMEALDVSDAFITRLLLAIATVVEEQDDLEVRQADE